jgi:ATP-dependent DNA helicase RecQ
MAAQLPAELGALRAIPGIGERKVVDFGSPFLAEIRAYVTETGAQPMAAIAAPRHSRPKRPSSSVYETLDLFRAGEDISSIAQTRGFAESTIEGHLAEAMDAGEQIDIDRVVAPQRRRAIEAAFKELGIEPLSSVKEHLGDAYSYGELRFTRAAMRRQQTEQGGGE